MFSILYFSLVFHLGRSLAPFINLGNSLNFDIKNGSVVQNEIGNKERRKQIGIDVFNKVLQGIEL